MQPTLSKDLFLVKFKKWWKILLNNKTSQKKFRKQLKVVTCPFVNDFEKNESKAELWNEANVEPQQKNLKLITRYILPLWQ